MKSSLIALVVSIPLACQDSKDSGTTDAALRERLEALEKNAQNTALGTDSQPTSTATSPDQAPASDQFQTPNAPGLTTGQLAITLDDPDVDLNSVSGYVVGFENQTSVQRSGGAEFFIDNVPEGSHDVILSSGTITLNDGAQLTASDEERGIRLNNLVFIANSRSTVDNLKIPVAGSLQGTATLEGSTTHLGIQVFIPGTSYTALTDENGNYRIVNVPVGTHRLAFQKDGYYVASVDALEVASDQAKDAGATALILSTGEDGLLRIEGGKEVSQRTVDLTIVASKNAVLMKISEDILFEGVPWRAFSSQHQYTFATPGQKTIFVKFADANGLESSPFRTSANVDLGSASLANPPPESSNTSELTLDVTGPAVNRYRYALVSGSSDCSPDAYSEWIATSRPTTVTLGIDGPKKFCLIGGDDYGAIQLTPTTYQWDKDSAAPTAEPTGLPPAMTATSAVNLTIGGDGVMTYRFSLAAGDLDCDTQTLSDWHSISDAVSAPTTTDGTWTLCLEGRDAAGNEQLPPEKFAWERDTAPPITTISGEPSSVSADAALLVYVGGEGVTTYQYDLLTEAADCGDANYSAWRDVSVPVNEATGSDGQKLLCVLGRDLAGNVQTTPTTHRWQKNTVPPSASLANAPADPSNSTQLNITVGGVGVTFYRYVLLSAGGLCSEATYSSWIAVTIPLSTAIGTDGDKLLCVVARDAIGNVQPIATRHDWTKDTTAPTATLTGAPVNESNATALSVSVGGVEVVEYAYALLHNSSNCAGATFSSLATIATSITSNLGSDGAKTLCVKGRDAAGNLQPTATSASWTKDTVAPTAIINAHSTIQGQNNATSLAVTISGDAVSEYQYAVLTESTSCAGASYSGWISVSTVITSSSGADGNKRLCVIGRDLAHNAQPTPVNTTWFKDTVAPSSSLSINSYVGPGQTVGVNTILNGSATDAATALQGVSVSIQKDGSTCLNSGRTAFDAGCPNYVAVSGTTSWSLTLADSIFTNRSTYTVDSRALDGAGNYQTSLGSATFTWDAEIPEKPYKLVAKGSYEAVHLFFAPSSAANGFLIVARANSAVTFTPTDGTTYATGLDLGSGQSVVYAGSNVTAAHTPLVNGTTYHYAIYAYSLGLNYGAAATATATPNPRAFTGINWASLTASGRLSVEWQGWNDGVTDQSDLSYETYWASTAATQDFGASPALTVSDAEFGEVSAAVGYDLYLVTRARKPDTSIDTNSQESLVKLAPRTMHKLSAKSRLNGVAQTNAPIDSDGVAVDPYGNIFSYNGFGTISVFCNENLSSSYCSGRSVGKVYTIVGRDGMDDGANNEVAVRTGIGQPSALAFDDFGNLYIADATYSRIRVVCYDTDHASFCAGKTAGNIYRLAGDGTTGAPSDNVAGTSSAIGTPSYGGLAIDRESNVYVADSSHRRLLVICYGSSTTTDFCFGKTAGNIYYFAGAGAQGDAADDLDPLVAQFQSVEGVAIDRWNNVFFTDPVSANPRIRVVCQDITHTFCTGKTVGKLYRVAGSGNESDPASGILASTNSIGYGLGLTADPLGNLFFYSNASQRIRGICFDVITPGTFCTGRTAGYLYRVAGTGSPGDGADNVPAMSASFYGGSLSSDHLGNLFLVDASNRRLRAVCLDTRLDGGFCDGKTPNYSFRVIYRPNLPTPAEDVPAASFLITGSDYNQVMQGTTVDPSGNIYFTTRSSYRIWVICNNVTVIGFCNGKTRGNVYYFLGNGSQADAVSNTPAASAQIGFTGGMATDPWGNYYVSDVGYLRVRVVCHNVSGGGYCSGRTAGNIYNIMGNGAYGDGADDVPATGASGGVGSIYGGLAVDAYGNVFAGDGTYYRLRAYCHDVSAGVGFCAGKTSGNSYRAAGTGTSGDGATNVAATAAAGNQIQALAVDPWGNAYMGEYNGRVRVACFKVGVGGYCNDKTAGNSYRLMGTGSTGNGADAGVATSTALGVIFGLAVDSIGNTYALESTNTFLPTYGAGRIRVVCNSTSSGFCSDKVVGNAYIFAGSSSTADQASGVASGTSVRIGGTAGGALAIHNSGDLIISSTIAGGYTGVIQVITNRY